MISCFRYFEFDFFSSEVDDGWLFVRIVLDVLPLFFQEDCRKVRAYEEALEVK